MNTNVQLMLPLPKAGGDILVFKRMEPRVKIQEKRKKKRKKGKAALIEVVV